MVRVRFAPSPTGFLHLGSIRTALYNYLFARKNNGKFIIRIEDTDQKRVVPTAIDSIIETLKWCKIEPDLGPFTEADRPAYIQSERIDIYKKHVYELLENGHAYRCFCSPVRLELIRRESAKRKERQGYDNKCRSLSQAEIDEKLGENLSFVIRLKLLSKPIMVKDIVFGESSIDLTESEGDPVLLKSDNFPTYHLGNVVDDHLMNITHVLRGVEWFKSTPKHVRIYEAFGWSPPEFAHLPLLTNPDATKLSKRNDDSRIDTLRSHGIHPLAIINFLSISGGGFNRTGLHHVLSLETLVDLFDIKKINTNNVRLNLDRLQQFNQMITKQRIENDMESLKDEFKQFLRNQSKLQGFIDERFMQDDYLDFVLRWSQHRFSNFQQLFNEIDFVWMEKFNYEWKPEDFTILGDIEKIITDLKSLVEREFKLNPKMDNSQMLKDYCESNSINFPKFMKLARLCLINRNNGPPISEILQVLGEKISLRRIESALEYVKK